MDKAPFGKYLFLSFVGHGLIFGYVLLAGFSVNHFKPPQIYSVTLEGGATLGGLLQVPDKKESQMAPPKKVAEAKDSDSKRIETKVDDAEVSLAKKEATPKPTAKPTKKPTPKPTKKPTPKPTAKKKATPKPTAKPKPKPKKTTPNKPKAKPTLSKADINKKLQQAVQRYKGESTKAGGQGFGAGKLGGSKMGGGIVRPPEFFRYKRLLESHIKSGWRWYDTSSALVSQVAFYLSAQGKISQITLASSSGNREFDDSVLRAVSKANPAPVPPSNVHRFFEEVRITFDPRE